MPSVSAPTPEADELAHYLAAFLHGDPEVRQQLPHRLRRRLLYLARHLAPDLAEMGLDEDVAQQFWALILTKSPDAFDPSRGTAIAYISLILRTAARDIRALHAPPGQRTRPEKDEDGVPGKHEHTVSLHGCIAVDESEELTLAETIVDSTVDVEMEACSTVGAEAILDLARETAPEPIACVLDMVWREAIPLGVATEIVGASRFVVRRRMASWVREHALVLVA